MAYTIDEARFRVERNCIDITVNPAPRNPKLAALEERIKILEEAGVDWDAINVQIMNKLDDLDVAQKSDLIKYLTKQDAQSLYQPIGEYLIRQNISLSDYNNLLVRDKNTLYIVD